MPRHISHTRNYHFVHSNFEYADEIKNNRINYVCILNVENKGFQFKTFRGFSSTKSSQRKIFQDHFLRFVSFRFVVVRCAVNLMLRDWRQCVIIIGCIHWIISYRFFFWHWVSKRPNRWLSFSGRDSYIQFSNRLRAHTDLPQSIV